MSGREITLRETLLEQVRHLPQAQLPYLRDVLAQLKSDPLPLSGLHAKRGIVGNVVASEDRISTTALPVLDIVPRPRDWPHAPLHRISEQGTYLVTAGTLYKQQFFHSADRLDLLESTLLELAMEYGWQLEAWAIFSNHYHFVGHSTADSAELNTFLSHLHSATATEINSLDSQPERQVWHNYWETQLTFQRSYLARLNYVHQNAIRHGLVRVANQYPWCSAAWFERTATPAQVKTIYGFKIDRLRVFDDFAVLMP